MACLRFRSLRALAALALAFPALAQQFPSNPTTAQQCEYANEQAQALANQYHARGGQYLERRDAVSRQRGASCRPGNNYDACTAPYDAQSRQYNNLAGEAFAERDRIIRAARAPFQQCMQIARAHEQQVEQQKQLAQENLRRQQQAQAEARRDNQARADAADRQRAAARNEPRIVQTPQMAAQLQEQARAEARRDQIEANIQTGMALKSLYGKYTGAKEFAADPDSGVIAGKFTDRAIDKGNDLRRDALGQSLNPQGYKNEAIDKAFESASKEGARIDRYRDTSPVASQMREDANAGIQAAFNNADGQLNNTINSMDELASPSPPSGNYAQPAEQQLQQPDQVDSLDQLADATPRSPNDACKLLAGTAASQCLANQCQLPQFRSHSLCRRTLQ